MTFPLLVDIVWCLEHRGLRFDTGQERLDVTAFTTDDFLSMVADLVSEISAYTYRRVISSAGPMNGC